MRLVLGISRKLFHGLNLAEQGLVFIGGILVFVFTFAAVITRYVLRIPSPYLDELTRFAFIAGIFIGVAVITRQKSHINVDLLSLAFRKEITRASIMWSLNLLLLVMSGYFAYLTYGYMRSTFASPASVSPTLGIHIGWMYGLPFVGSALWSFELVVIVVKDGIDLLKGGRQKGHPGQ